MYEVGECRILYNRGLYDILFT